MHASGKRLLLGTVLLAGPYLGLYLLPANLFLAGPAGPQLLGRHPERLRIEWGSAWSLWPGRVEIRGLRVEGASGRVKWSLAVDRGSGRIDLPALLSRDLWIRGFEGQGVRARVARHPPNAAQADRSAAIRRSRRLRRPWTVRLDGVRLDGVHELEYGPLRLEGKGSSAGALRLVLGREVQGDLELELDGGRLLVKGETVARDLSVRTGLRLGPYAPGRHPGANGLDFLSGTLQASGEMTGLPPALRPVSGPAASPPGRLVLDLRVERGSLFPGSRVELALPAGGNGSRMAVAGSVVPGRAKAKLLLSADLQRFALHRSADRPPLLEAERLRVTAATSQLRLSRLLPAARDLRGAAPVPWTLPGELRAEGLRLTFPGSRTSLEVAASHGSGRIDLPALLRREVRLAGVKAEGALVRVTGGAPPRVETPGSGRNQWTARLAGVHLAGGCEVDLGGFRLAGDLQAEGDLSWSDGALALDRIALKASDGRLEREGKAAAQELDLLARLRFGPYAPRQSPGAGWLDVLSGTVEGAGEVIDLQALRRASGPAPADLRSGRLAFALQVERGTLLPGSRAELASRRRGSPTTLAAAVEPATGGPQLLLQADLAGFAVRRSAGPPLLESKRLRAKAATAELRLGALLANLRELRGTEPAAWTLPGELWAEGLRLTFPGSRASLEVGATRGSGRIDLPSLLRREIRLDAVRLEGARLRLSPGAPPRRARPGGARGAWTAELANLRLSGSCESSLGGSRFEGDLRAAGDLSWSGEALAFDRASVELSAGRLRRGGETVARGLRLTADGRLAPLAPGRVQGLEVLRLVSGRGKLGGSIASLGFLQPYLEKASWLALDGQGSLQADLRLDRGRLLPGSRFAVDPARIRAEYLLSRATGSAALTGVVARTGDGGVLDIRVEFDRFEIAAREPRDTRPHVHGRGLSLTLVTRDLDLARPGKDVRARLDLPAAEVTDLTVYNSYLPPQSGVEIVSGTGRIRLRLEMETAGRTGRGEVALTSPAVRVRLNDVELAGTLDLRAPLASPDLRQPRFGLDGTRLVLERVALREIGTDSGEPAAPGWWARLELARAAMDWSRPLSVSGSVRLAMKDSGLLLSLFARRRRFLNWFRGVLDVEGVEARGDLRLDRGAVVLDPLVATGRGIELRSRLRFSRERRRGYLLVRHGRLAVGIELRDGQRNYRFLRPLEWFESREAP